MIFLCCSLSSISSFGTEHIDDIQNLLLNSPNQQFFVHDLIIHHLACKIGAAVCLFTFELTEESFPVL